MPGERDNARNNAKVGEEDHAWPGWTTSRRGQDSVEESVRMTEDRDKCRKYVHGVANPRIEDC